MSRAAQPGLHAYAAAVSAADEDRPRSFPKGRPLSADEREEWLKSWLLVRAVGWEIYALAAAVAAVREEQDILRRTLLLEATLTHARCLTEFLVGRLDKKSVRRWKHASDVTPGALMATWDPEIALGDTLASLDQALPELDSLLAHVSQRRVAIVRRSWEVAGLTRSLLAALRRFEEHLRREEPFRADCLQGWLSVADEHLTDRGVDLASDLEVLPTSSIMFVVPVGESGGRAAALMTQAHLSQD